MRRINATTAIELLTCFRRKQLTLTRSMFDACFDAVTDELERANNEAYRLHEDPEETQHHVPQEK